MLVLLCLLLLHTFIFNIQFSQTQVDHIRLVSSSTSDSSNYDVLLQDSAITTSEQSSDHYLHNAEGMMQPVADGFPRVILASPCAGSSATLQFTKVILHAHGYQVDSKVSEPLLKLKRQAVIQNATDHLTEQLSREPTYAEIVAESISILNQNATENGKIYLFKANSLGKVALDTLKKLGTKFAATYRESTMDQAVCMAMDCFANIGHPVFANGTRSDLCFARRKADVKLLVDFDDIDKLKHTIERIRSDNEVRRNHDSLYSPALYQSYEDLFKFEYTDSEKVFDESVFAWQSFLFNFGEIKEDIVREVLRPHHNSRPAPSHYSTRIHNFEKLQKDMEAKGMLI
jgi:hypothetical protein